MKYWLTNEYYIIVRGLLVNYVTQGRGLRGSGTPRHSTKGIKTLLKGRRGSKIP